MRLAHRGATTKNHDRRSAGKSLCWHQQQLIFALGVFTISWGFAQSLISIDHPIGRTSCPAIRTATKMAETLGRSVTAVDVDDGTVQYAMEQTVKRYFQGVHEKNLAKIRQCFDETVLIHDIVVGRGGPGSMENRTVASSLTSPPPVRRTGDEMVQRCVDFVTAHPDVEISFLYGPECGRNSHWVVTHWLETGTWSGVSCGIPAPSDGHRPMTVQGQTRCLVDPNSLTIVELVVTRTYTEWETHLVAAAAPSVT